MTTIRLQLKESPATRERLREDGLDITWSDFYPLKTECPRWPDIQEQLATLLPTNLSYILDGAVLRIDNQFVKDMLVRCQNLGYSEYLAHISGRVVRTDGQLGLNVGFSQTHSKKYDDDVWLLNRQEIDKVFELPSNEGLMLANQLLSEKDRLRRFRGDITSVQFMAHDLGIREQDTAVGNRYVVGGCVKIGRAQYERVLDMTYQEAVDAGWLTGEPLGET